MTFAPTTPTRTREETRARIAEAVTEMSRGITLSTIDATLKAAEDARHGRSDDVTLLRVAVLAANARHLATHVDTILLTGMTEGALPLATRPALHRSPTTHRSLSVGAVIHKFATLHSAFNAIHPVPLPPQVGNEDLCEDALPG